MMTQGGALTVIDRIERTVRNVLGNGAVLRAGWFSFNLPPKVDQGWKLHISATIASAELVLQRVLPLLVDAHVPFKVVKDLGGLSDLNDGCRNTVMLVRNLV
jgi:hypothetical protein